MTLRAIDLFAGGGGWSLGWQQATGASPVAAVNHCAHAIRLHALNHPETRHFHESVQAVDPIAAAGGRRVDWLHLSPDCTHFSRAKGGKPREQGIRGLAWCGVDWAEKTRPRILSLENVPEFETWGPLLEDGRPDPARAGETFRQFVEELHWLGYRAEWRVLCAADFGAPTIRRRLFLIARRDGQPIRWPEPTHGLGRALPWRTAAECIDWSIPCPSIFGRKRPLAAATCRRIAAGVVRYVLQGRPFIVCLTHGGRTESADDPLRTITTCNGGERALVAPSFSALRGTSPAHLHGDSAAAPLRTVSAGGQHHALVGAFLAKHYGGMVGSDMRVPVGTVTGTDHHSLVAGSLVQVGYGERDGQSPRALDLQRPLGTIVAGGSKHALVASFLVQYYSQGRTSSRADAPLPAVVTKARHGLVTVEIDGATYVLADIGLRMLQPRELARAQGFPDSYVLEGSKAQQIARIGNSVVPQIAAAIVRANLEQEAAVA